jgi:hypothetical protein
MNASNKQPTLAEKFAAVWEKKNAKAARAGGVSLMALSLAACGSDDTATTTATTDTTTTTTDTTTVVTPVAGETMTLTTAVNSGSAFTGGAGDDTFQATHLTLTSGDTLNGGEGTDTLNIQNTGTGAYTAAAATVSGIENISVINQSGSTAVTAVSAVTAVAQVTTVTAKFAAANTDVITVNYGSQSQIVKLTGLINQQGAATNADIIVAAVNGMAGATIAVARTTNTTNDHILDVTAPTAGTALPVISFDTATVTADYPTVAATTANVEAVTAVTGVAATDASIMTVVATNFTGATTFTTNGSTGLTNFTGLAAGQSANMHGGSGGMGAAYGATVTSAALDISGGTTAGNVTLTGAAVTSTAITGTGKTNTVGTIDLAASSTVTLDAATKFTATQIDTTATAGSLTITGAGAVNIGTLDDGFVTVSAAGNSGGLTMTGPANSPNASITLSSGNDVFTTDDDGFSAAQTFAVNGGDGTDVLVVAAAADINAASESARYTNFETVRINDTYDADQIAGITAIQLAGAATKSYTDLTATQAASIQVRGDETAATFALKTATGTADALNLTMGTGLTTSSASDIVTGMTVTGFETISITENGGASAAAGADQTAIVAAFTTPTTLNNVDLAGRAVTLSNIATTVAVDIDGTALTGNGNASGVQGLTVAGSAVAGSVINGSAVNDSMTVGAEGSTYNGNAGTDAFVATAALILADGATDLALSGGAGTDTLTLSNTTGNTLTDAHFTNLTGLEALTLTNTGNADTSITTGAAFNTAFASGVTITSGAVDNGNDITVAGGLSTVDMTISIAATSQTGAATETNSIITGSGADTVTYVSALWVGVSSGAGGTFAIDTNAGNDTISVTTGTFVSTTTAGILDITGGSGQDSITVNAAKVNDGANDVGCVRFFFAAGDSNTVTYDTITGFDTATGAVISDELDFEGTAAVASFTANNDFGTILSHSVTTGVVTFDDAASFVAAITMNAGNLADAVGYLAANMTANHTAAFAFDSTGDGAADGTMMFHQGSAAGVADDLVFLAGVTGVADVSITTNNTGAGDLFIA